MTFFQLIVVIFACFNINVSEERNNEFFVGAIFSEDQENEVIAIRAAIEQSNANERSFRLIPIIKFVPYDENFMLENVVCDLISDGVIAIFGTPSKKSGIVGAICHSVKIPHIIFEYKPELRHYEKQFHSMTINVYPNDLKLAAAYASVVQSLGWDRYGILYESDLELIQLQDVLQIHGPENKPVIVRKLNEDGKNLPLLKEIKEFKTPCLIIHCATENILPILQQAKELDMLGEYMSYFLAPLDTHTTILDEIKTAAANITTMRIVNPSDYEIKNIAYNWMQREKAEGRTFSLLPSEIETSMLMITDAVSIFSKALAAADIVDEMTSPDLDCRGTESWLFGNAIIDAMKEQRLDGLTGPLLFDHEGQRSDFKVHILELTDEGFIDIAVWDQVNGISEIINSDELQRRLDIKKVFKVSSRIGKPFLFDRSEFTNDTLYGNDRYEGYSMDLIAAIAKISNFTFEFVLAPDKKYGNLDKDTGKWNGIIREVMDGNADMGICDLTMTSLRREVVDFTPPFMTLGISLMYAQAEEPAANLFSFIDPFSPEVWKKMCLALVGLILLEFICARMAPPDWENPHPCKTEPEELENVWTVKNSIWLAVGSLMGQGCDLLPKAPSTRIITGMWWFFALMMLNSYTANLAAFLTTSGVVDTIKSVEELAQQNKVKYGTLDGGSTQSFFEHSNESLYQKMWSVMASEDPSVFPSSNDLGEERVVKSKRRFAFFMESSVLEYKIERNCAVLQVGSWLDYKTYGIAMPFNSRHRKMISEAVLKLSESGELANLKRRWWKEKHGGGQCAASGPAATAGGPMPLALKHVGGVFILLGIGIVIGFFIAIFEFFWNLKTVSLEEKITLKDAFKLEAEFAMKFWIVTKPVRTSGGSTTRSSRESLSKISSKSGTKTSVSIKNNIENNVSSVDLHNQNVKA